MVRWAVDRIARRSAADAEMSPGTLLATGYIAGGTIGGVVIGFMNFSPTLVDRLDLTRRLGPAWNDSNWPAVLAFSGLIVVLVIIGLRRFASPPQADNEPVVTR
jgi:hypothetical protein